MKKKQNRALERTKKLVLSAIFSAACFLLMYVGALTEVTDLCAVVICALIVIVAVIELRGMWPWMIWLVTSTLCLFLLPNPQISLEFVLFGGLYPMVKAFLEKYPLFIQWTLKLTFFNLAFAGTFYGSVYLFGFDNIGFKLNIIAFLLANIYFLISDFAFTMIISIYMVKIRPRLKLDKKA